jgi:hypothetical protein
MITFEKPITLIPFSGKIFASGYYENDDRGFFVGNDFYFGARINQHSFVRFFIDSFIDIDKKFSISEIHSACISAGREIYNLQTVVGHLVSEYWWDVGESFRRWSVQDFDQQIRSILYHHGLRISKLKIIWPYSLKKHQNLLLEESSFNNEILFEQHVGRSEIVDHLFLRTSYSPKKVKSKDERSEYDFVAKIICPTGTYIL